MKVFYIALLALLFSGNSFAQCAIATANNSYGVYCDSAGDIDVQAAQNCEKSGGHNCIIIAHFSNSCWAIAKDAALGVSASAYGYSTLNEAKLSSINKCLGSGGKNCSNTRNVGCEGATQFNTAQPSSSTQSSSQQEIAAPSQIQPSVNNSPICNQLRRQLKDLIDGQHGFLVGLKDAAATGAWQKQVIADEKYNNQQLILQYSQQIQSQCGG